MKPLAIGIISLLYLSGPSIADAASASGANDHWVVSQLTGDARLVHPGLRPVSLKLNAEIVSGDTLVTGANGRATLVRGADYIIVAPHSELRLPTAAQPSGFTRVVESMGTMLFKIQHTGIPHFAVDTPMLAAVVKGTTFTVVVDQNRSAVQVIQGVVQVTATDGGMMRLVEGGRTAFINRAEPKVLLDADKPSVRPAAPSSTNIQISVAGESPLAAIAQLTSGLVRPDTASLATSPVQATTPTTVAAQQVPGTVLAAASASTSGGGVIIGPAKVEGVGTSALNVGSGPTSSGPTITLASLGTPGVTVPAVITPTVSVPVVINGSVSTPDLSVPSVTTPVVIVPAVTTSDITISNVTTVGASVAAVTVPSLTTSTVTVPSVSTPVITTPVVTVPAITTPVVTVPAVTTPVVTTPVVSVPAVTTPVVTTPVVTIPAVTTPVITVPAVTTPVVTTPAVSVPVVTTPIIATPVVTVPIVITPPPILGH